MKAIEEIIVSGSEVTLDELEFTNGKTAEFEDLFLGGEEGRNGEWKITNTLRTGTFKVSVDAEDDTKLVSEVAVSQEKDTFENVYSSGGNNGGTSGGGGGGSNRITTITAEEVPLANAPDVLTDPMIIDDGEIPLAALPKTGQGTAKATITMMMSGIFLLLTVIGKKRKEEL